MQIMYQIRTQHNMNELKRRSFGSGNVKIRLGMGMDYICTLRHPITPSNVQNHIFHMKITVVAILTELLVSISFHSEYDDMSVMHSSIIESNWDTIYTIYTVTSWPSADKKKSRNQQKG